MSVHENDGADAGVAEGRAPGDLRTFDFLHHVIGLLLHVGG